MREQYERGLNGFCIDDIDIEANAIHHWFPRTCCSKHAKYDKKRTPGLFKLEYQGDEMIGLCSKTYIVCKTKVIRPSSKRMAALHILNKAKRQKNKLRRLQTRRINEYKFSSKGVSKRHLKLQWPNFDKFWSPAKHRVAAIPVFESETMPFLHTPRNGEAFLTCIVRERC